MYIPEEYKSRVLIAPEGTATSGGGYLTPTPGLNSLTVRAVVNMGNATDLALTLKSADDATGTNATNFSDVPVFVDGTKQDNDAHAYTVSEDTGTTIVDFCIMPSLLSEGRTIGLAFGASNAANIIAAEIIEDTAYKPAN